MPARHHDAPATEQAFRRLAATSEGHERYALREELVDAWLPMARRPPAQVPAPRRRFPRPWQRLKAT